MGAEQSKYEGPPEVLEARDLASVAKYMKSSACKNVFTMLGAGISTSAGIPDFRSPETGLYANLARLNLPHPEAVFEINYFRDNPRAFYTLAHDLLPGRFRPTATHSFVRLLNDHKFLHTCFTQNIDTLERRAGVPGNKIVEAHGSFASQHCIECSTEYDGEKMRQALKTGEIARCPECDGLVKPDIVFFGEALPQLFHQSVPNLRNADLLFVIGTSLTVQPFASLASLVPAHCPRVLINLDPVGDFGNRSDDVICLGRCDEVVRDLCKELGWGDELEAAWKETEHSLDDFGEEGLPEKGPGPTVAEEEKQLEEDVEEITERLNAVLGEVSDKASPETEGNSQSPILNGAEIPVLEDEHQTQALENPVHQEAARDNKETKEKL
ncbi:DHS-like NAD/FAD-binding domain-containing protein [Fomitopsis serialis]|uniref:DHS-like NAD/FAD-binding domain-containing protein n=1 Tax=Fomitopsis serialis TaxID=139415 RepID=UPI002008A5DB|nr:DHS-like NAD/FAD-binding domain-containing protein [Neoantrodia serialis]KAH9936341.1 DHS-like NAD/FAD-binding domain-containing protein [Neoantrodia serialis]